MKKENRIKKRTFFGSIIVLLLTLFLTAGFGYAYWAASIDGDTKSKTGVIEIGTGEAITTTLTINPVTINGSQLVPTGYDIDGKVDRAILKFPILWNGTGAVGAESTITASIIKFEINDIDYIADPNIYGLFTIVFDNNDIVAGTQRDYHVTVIFSLEPANQAVYDIIAGQDITIEVQLIVAPITNP